MTITWTAASLTSCSNYFVDLTTTEIINFSGATSSLITTSDIKNLIYNNIFICPGNFP
jgi:hypothetical protein